MLSNAIKYTPRGGRITLSLRPEDGGVRLAVADTGIGIAPQDRGRLFAKFSRIKPSITGQEGTGLGLFIAKTIVEAHGGTITVESKPGAGSAFELRLPGKTRRSA